MSSLIFLIAGIIAGAHAQQPLPTQTNFDAASWQGWWFELYSLPQADESLCTCTASNFTQTLQPGKWSDLNYCKRFGGMEKVPLSMYQLDRRYPERLAIGTSPAHTFTKMWIISTDYKTYSLIGDPSRKALWIYGRKAGIDRGLYANLTSMASQLGFDIAKFKMTDQMNDCKYSESVTIRESKMNPTASQTDSCTCTGVFSARMLCCAERPKDLNCTYDDQKAACVHCPHGVEPKAPFQCNSAPSPFPERSTSVVPLQETIAPPTLDCTFQDPATLSIGLTHSGSGNIKIRTCRNGIGCVGDKGKWNSFKDCANDVGPGQNVTLKFEQKVVYFVFLNRATGATDEFWQPKSGVWPATHAITV